MIVQSVGKLLKSFEKTVEVHLVIIAPTHNVFVNYIIMSFQNVAVGETGIFGKFLKLRTSYKIITFLTCKYFKHFLGVRVKIELIQLTILQRQYFLHHSYFMHLL